jgi:outer membrane lipoprotein-sorting protein
MKKTAILFLVFLLVFPFSCKKSETADRPAVTAVIEEKPEVQEAVLQEEAFPDDIEESISITYDRNYAKGEYRAKTVLLLSFDEEGIVKNFKRDGEVNQYSPNYEYVITKEGDVYHLYEELTAEFKYIVKIDETGNVILKINAKKGNIIARATVTENTITFIEEEDGSVMYDYTFNDDKIIYKDKYGNVLEYLFTRDNLTGINAADGLTFYSVTKNSRTEYVIESSDDGGSTIDNITAVVRPKTMMRNAINLAILGGYSFVPFLFGRY